jgi:deoxyribose-phosphate aldolase
MGAEIRRDRAARLLGLLDLTRLDERCSEADVIVLCEAALVAPRPAAICIWPQFAGAARRRLGVDRVAIATVVNFPAGGEDPERVAEDISETVGDGADEIDLVMPWRALLRGDRAAVRAVLSAARESTGAGVLLKVIIESGELGTEEPIREATRLAIAEGADFVKTSTGRSRVSATPEAARVMLEEIRNAGRPVGFKAAGGIRTFDDADLYLRLAEEILGSDAGNPARFRIGASALREALLGELRGTTPQAERGATY